MIEAHILLQNRNCELESHGMLKEPQMGTRNLKHF